MGQLTPTWRLLTGLAWVMVFVSFTGAWNVSRQLGLGTWWLGPVSQPRPLYISVIPFLPSVVMLVLMLNDTRRLPVYGLVASVAVAAVGIGDLDEVRRLGVVEIVIGAAAALVTIASFSGMYRRAVDADRDPGDAQLLAPPIS